MLLLTVLLDHFRSWLYQNVKMLCRPMVSYTLSLNLLKKVKLVIYVCTFPRLHPICNTGPSIVRSGDLMHRYRQWKILFPAYRAYGEGDLARAECRCYELISGNHNIR